MFQKVKTSKITDTFNFQCKTLFTIIIYRRYYDKM